MELCAQDLISGHHHHHHHDVCTVLQQQLLLSACYSFLLLLNSWQDISYPDTCHRLICILLIDRIHTIKAYTKSSSTCFRRLLRLAVRVNLQELLKLEKGKDPCQSDRTVPQDRSHRFQFECFHTMIRHICAQGQM